MTFANNGLIRDDLVADEHEDACGGPSRLDFDNLLVKLDDPEYSGESALQQIKTEFDQMNQLANTVEQLANTAKDAGVWDGYKYTHTNKFKF